MKRIYLSLILLFVAASAALLWQGNRIREKESALKSELSLSPQPASTADATDSMKTSASGRPSRPRADSFDPRHFLTEIDDLVAAAGTDDRALGRSLRMFLSENKDRLAAASPAVLKETCANLEKGGLDGANGFVWNAMMMEIAKSDPAWAISGVDRAVTSMVKEQPTQAILQALGKEGQLGSATWSPAYAAALDKWLDTAQAAGRLQGMEERVASLRFDSAVASGNLSTAILQLAHVSPGTQSRQLDELVAATADSPEQRRRMIEEVAKIGNPDAFQKFFQSLSKHAGFEVTRDILKTTTLTPANHDLAAAGIAAANIGPETAARAGWFIASLRSKETGAVTEFAATWTQAAHQDAGAWLGTLPAGDVRDAAVVGFATTAAKLDGASAAEWALTLADPALRESTLNKVYQTWKDKDPETADAIFKDNIQAK